MLETMSLIGEQGCQLSLDVWKVCFCHSLKTYRITITTTTTTTNNYQYLFKYTGQLLLPTVSSLSSHKWHTIQRSWGWQNTPQTDKRKQWKGAIVSAVWLGYSTHHSCYCLVQTSFNSCYRLKWTLLEELRFRSIANIHHGKQYF